MTSYHKVNLLLIFRRRLEDDLLDYRCLIDRIEHYFAGEAASHRRQFEDTIDEDAAEDYADDLQLLTRVLPQANRSALFLSLYGYVECQVLWLCRYMVVEGSRVRTKDLRGSGLEQASVFLEKVAGLKVEGTLLKGAEYELLKLTRNNLAHNHGQLNPETQNRFEALKKNCQYYPHLILDHLGNLEFNVNVLHQLLGRAERMFDTITTQLEEEGIEIDMGSRRGSP